MSALVGNLITAWLIADAVRRARRRREFLRWMARVRKAPRSPGWGVRWVPLPVATETA